MDYINKIFIIRIRRVRKRNATPDVKSGMKKREFGGDGKTAFGRLTG